MNCRIAPFLWIISVCLVFISCNKGELTSGEESISYESGEYLNILTNYKVTIGSGGSSKLYVENADPYRDILGSIIHNNAETNGATNLRLSDVKCTSINMECRNELLMSAHLTDARLVVYDNNAEQRSVLADLINFDATTKLLNFNLNGGDYADLFRDFSSKDLYFEFDFNGLPPSNIDVNYEITVESAYTYE